LDVKKAEPLLSGPAFFVIADDGSASLTTVTASMPIRLDATAILMTS
jgi:hypothetical protein